jgi:hypothetical protein
MVSLNAKLQRGQRIPVKVLVSVLFGVVGYGASQAVDSSNVHLVLGLAVSLFIAGIAFVVQFLYDVEKRREEMETEYEARAGETEQRITNGFTKINQATELFGLVEASALKTDAMTQLVRNSTRIESSPALVFEFAQAEIARLSEMLKTLGEGGDVTYEGEDRDWLLGLAKTATSTIDATSLTTVDAGGKGFVDGGLWSSDLGQRYLDAQRDAIRRNVAIRRIFIMDRPELVDDPDFLSICRFHEAIGIQVKIFDPSAVASVRRDSLFDFVIFDSVLSYQTTPASRVGDNSRPVIISTRLVTHQSAVQDRIQRFQDLWREAQGIDEKV